MVRVGEGIGRDIEHAHDQRPAAEFEGTAAWQRNAVGEARCERCSHQSPVYSHQSGSPTATGRRLVTGDWGLTDYSITPAAGVYSATERSARALSGAAAPRLRRWPQTPRCARRPAADRREADPRRDASP